LQPRQRVERTRAADKTGRGAHAHSKHHCW
jgi:hypothetical protein